ncbi:hypothetical protein Goshw_018120 [Gossypium schwendimanii]|uniref:Fatty acid desaturase domain-containing protein n=1 Tax=Gossypium schwendimanii TaxID=34291 RepID=A0A7J9MTS4_GOSSC|nr:hypothetical protein [Gossypium schwendimanii]
MVVLGKKNKENRGWVNRVLIEKPPFTLGQIKQAIPPYCFRRSLLRSFSYVGCILAGDECGHHAFSGCQWVDDTVGLILHSALLVPYFSWKMSHRRYHSNTDSMERDEVFVPKPKSKLSCFAKYLNNPPDQVLSLVVTLTLGWLMYLAFNVSGRYYDRLVSHYNLYGPIYFDCERLQVYISDASIFVVIYVIYKIAVKKGLAWLLCTYGVPLLIVNAFLVLLLATDSLGIVKSRASVDSASVKHGRPAFTGARLVQLFPRHETIKLDEVSGGLAYSESGCLDVRSTGQAQMACDVWNTATRLFVAFIGTKLSCLCHDLQSLKKGSLSVKEYVARIQNTSALIEASGSLISEAVKVEIVLAGLPPEFDADVPLHANLLEIVLLLALVGSVRGGRSRSEGRGRGFRSCIQCQIYRQFKHLAQMCFFRYNREYDSLSSVVRASNLADRHGPGVSFPFDGTLIYKAMWRKAKECLYVEPDVGGGDSKGVFWYRNKF